MAKPEQLGGLVEGLTKRIVNGGAPALIFADPGHQDQLAVPAGDEQQQIGETKPVGQARGQRMRLQMIDGDKGFARGGGEPLGHCQPDKQTADQPRSGRRGNRVDTVQRQSRFVKGAGNDGVEMVDMRPRGKFGHDTAKGGVFGDLAAHNTGQDGTPALGIARDNRCGSLVAACFDTKDQCRRLPAHVKLVYGRSLGSGVTCPTLKGAVWKGSGLHSVAHTQLLTIGTRGSPLALIQAQMVRKQLAGLHQISEEEIGIEIIRTGGDRTQAENLSLSEVGGKGVFSTEIEDALIAGRVDVGVHSAKDMATRLPAGLVMDIFLEREDVRDAFVSVVARSIEDLAEGAVFGTSSIRRAAQILSVRPDLKIVPFRGNVGTRIEKLKRGEATATFLAVAGLKRSGDAAAITQIMDPAVFPPAPAQGAIGLEIRADDARTMDLCAPINHEATRITVRAERAMLGELDGSCRTPIAALTQLSDAGITLFGQVLSPDSQVKHEVTQTGPRSAPEALGMSVGVQLRDMAGPDFFAGLDRR